MAYTTLADVKAYLKMTDINVDDSLLSMFIPMAEDIINEETERVFECPTDTTRKFDVYNYRDYTSVYPYKTQMYFNYYDSRVLWFNSYDICQITTVTNGDGVVIPSNQYVTLPINATPYFAIRLKLDANQVFTWDNAPDAAIHITGRWAYSITPPPGIRYATLRLVQSMYRQKDTNVDSMNDRNIVTNAGTVMANSWPPDVTKILGNYRRQVL